VRFVLDCSITMAWCFADEADGYADAVLDLLPGAEALVPAIWPLEVANVLLVAERRKRINEAQLARLVELLRSLPVIVDRGTLDRVMGAVLPLAREHKLSAYDAAYLELAMREGIPLATRDDRLAEAAHRCGVPLVREES
jgi:predicted nucleic acid-binding protein